jgi:hypothetical protein
MVVKKKDKEKTPPPQISANIAYEFGIPSDKATEKIAGFVNSLDENEKVKLKIALKYYKEELELPDNIYKKLGEKNMTNDKAKAIIKSYIYSN